MYRLLCIICYDYVVFDMYRLLCSLLYIYIINRITYVISFRDSLHCT